MAKTNSKKKQRQQKKKQKQRQSRGSDHVRKEKSEFYYCEALWYIDSKNYDKAETLLKRAIKRDPGNREKLVAMARLGYTAERNSLVIESLLELYKKQLLDNTPDDNDFLLMLCSYLLHDGQYQTAKAIAEDIEPRLKSKEMKVRAKKTYQKKISEIISYANQNIYFENLKRKNRIQRSRAKDLTSPAPAQAPAPEPSSPTAKDSRPEKSGRFQLESIPTIPISIHMDQKRFSDSCVLASMAKKAEYDLVLDAMQIRLKETFDHLLCLNSLQGIASFLYQEETARKVLKSFRGRALLADEVGMGKTIEAGLVLKEYILRGMVKNFLILTPTPLVSQWREELKTKFDLNFHSTDDIDFRAAGDRFWEHPFIVASINIAKSKKHFSAVTAREYDIVIVDEAHHLKNRTTLNWKLVNTLKKRFLLLLTATPVENNLMELYNLITLLKPGQLNTASAFKDEFMTRGDPTDPQNRSKLRGLLDQVMIRNTRAVANINIPPRFAETIRIKPTANETELYNRITGLVHAIKYSGTSSKRMILKHLLAEAGSSPAAVEKTLSTMPGKGDLSEDHINEIRAIRNLTRSMGDTGKNKAVIKLINATRDKIIIFVKYRATLDHLSDVLTWQGIAHSLFHGQMPNAQKDREIQKFKTDARVLVTTELGGEGRNLQFCHRMINYDLPWNPMRIEQRIGRIHRIGQENEVLIYNLCAAGSIEDYILEILDKKINMFEMVIGEIDMIIGRMRGEQDFSDMIYDIWVNSPSDEQRRESFIKLGTQLKRCKTGYEKTRILDEKLFGENYEL